MKKQFIIKNSTLTNTGVDSFRTMNGVWKAEDTIHSILFEKMIVTVEQPMFEIVTVYVNG